MDRKERRVVFLLGEKEMIAERKRLERENHMVVLLNLPSGQV